jgi:protein-S-isoprenylcysteine O-methyltransferase Ste14
MTGPYRYVRHPFSAAFILALVGALLALPHWATLALLVYGTLQLGRTARLEERQILAGPAGEAYAAYVRRTGRFLPAARVSRIDRRARPPLRHASEHGARSAVAVTESIAE